MIVYKYDDQGYYIGEHNCQKCPKTGGWLYPANYTEIAPPAAQKNKISKFNKGKWIVVDNFTGEQIWNKQTLQIKTCETPDVPEGYTAEAPATPYDDWNEKKSTWITNTKKQKEAEWMQIRAERNARLTASDWTQLPDADLTDKEKAAYTKQRQQLRDIPQDFDDPDKIVWPEKK
jgi:hypothetical protein